LTLIAPHARPSLLHILKAQYITNQSKGCKKYHAKLGLLLELFRRLTDGGVRYFVENGVNVGLKSPDCIL
jgi:hypothetical protein